MATITYILGTGGVSYAKVNKIDNQGQDNTLSLQELTHLRILFDDFGIVDFPVLTITEYPTYFLYKIEPPEYFGRYINEFKSPTNPNTTPGNYNLVVNTTSPIFYGYTNTTGSIGADGLYKFPNGGLPVLVSCSFAVTKNNVQANRTFDLIFTGSEGIVWRKTFDLPSPSAAYIYNTSLIYTPVSGATLGIAFESSSLTINPLVVSLSSIDFKLDQYTLNSVNNNILNYYTSASNNTNQSSSILKYNSVAGNTLNYLNISSGIYTAGDTPNIPVTISASAVLNSTTGTSYTNLAMYYVNQNGSLGSQVTGFSSTVIAIPPAGSGTTYLSGSFIPIENSRYAVVINDDSPSPADITSSYARFLVTQSVSPYTSSNLTVLEPYLTSQFANSDCDVLMNNAVTPEFDNIFMKVNYETGQFIPTNQEEIINNTAERAPVKPYNYSLLSQILPRYNGVKVTQQEENKWTGGDIGYGKSPSVQSLNNYIAYFEWIGGTSPELIGKSAAYIKYLIDKDGNTTVPSLSSPYYYNLIDNYETNKNVILSLNTTENSNVYKDVGPVPIIRAGALPTPILASQTGSNPTVISPLRFITSSLSIVDYTTNYVNSTTQTVNPNTSAVLTLTSQFPGGNPNSSLASNEITIITTSNTTRINLSLPNSFYFFSPGGNTIVQLNFQKFVGSTWVNVSSQTGTVTNTAYMPPYAVFNNNVAYPYYNSANTNFNNIPYFIPIAGDKYRVLITNLSPSFAIQILSSNLQVGQSPALGGTVTFPTSPYFTTGSNSKNIITGSTFNAFYSPGSPSTQAELTGSGYFQFLPFVVKPNDQIRFEGDESQVYNIIEADVVSPANTNFYIRLDRNIVDGTNLNSFLIRRLDPNPNFVTLDYDVSVNSVGKGFMIPEYATNELQQNYNKIIEKLKIDGLI